MKRRNNVIEFLNAVLFIGVLFAPEVQRRFQLLDISTLSENRAKITEPIGDSFDTSLIEKIYIGGQKFTKAYEKFYNDHYGFRDLLIKIKNQIDFSIFNFSDEIVIGEDGFLFFKNQVEGDLIKAELVSDVQEKFVQDSILQFAEWCRKRDKKLIVLLCRDKWTLYGEKISHGTTLRPNPDKSDKYVEFFSAQPHILFLDTKDTLQTTKQISPVFYKTDFHWNSVGAFVVGRELVNLISNEAKISQRWREELQILETPGYSGTENLYLATLNPHPEIAYSAAINWDKNSITVDPPPSPFEKLSHNTSSEALIPPTVIVGNSFSPYFFNTPLPEYFQEVSYVFKGYLQYGELDDLFKPHVRYVVLQVNEFDLGTFFTNTAVWQKVWDSNAKS